MSLARALAELVLTTPRENVTPVAMDACKRLMIDTVGVSVAGWNAPGIPELHRQLRAWGGAAEATALIYGSKLPAPNSAMLNAAMAHALDYDDLHDPSALHISCVVFPAVLAAGEMAGASGRDLLVAMTLGIEAACRIGMPYNRRRAGNQGRGFLPTSVIGGFGAAWAACRLLGHTVDQAVYAAGINYAQASGNRQALFEKTLTKRLQPAFTARNALWAAILAGAGMTGPERCFEDEAGLFRVYLDKDPPTPDEVLQPRPHFELQRNTIKRFTSCGLAHPLTQAALDLAREHHLTRDDLLEVAIYAHGGPDGENLTNHPFTMGENPQVDAQFCNAYGVAVALLRGKAGLAEFTNERIRQDNEVAELARRVKILAHLDDAPPAQRIEDDFPPHVDKPHVLIVKTRDGRELRKSYTIRYILSPERMPMSQTIAKFHECAQFSRICAEEKAERIVRTIQNLDQIEDVSELVSMCAFER